MIQRMVLFGASGDLTSRLLLPAVSQLAERDALPPGLTIVGGALTDWTTQDFRERMTERLREHSPAPASAQDQVVRMLDFAPADATDPADVRRVIGEDGPSTLESTLPCHLRSWSRPSRPSPRQGCAPTTP